MELSDRTRLFLPQTVQWNKGDLHVFLDPERPHWVAVDARGARIVEWMEEGFSVGDLVRRYATEQKTDNAKAWLHVTDFVGALLRCGFASEGPRRPAPYQGRAAYARPTGLKELWFHTNNICNLSCSHCLVSSAPWVQDWGIPTERFLQIVEEAAEMGVDRFYFTGGEPFMRRDIFRLIRHITEEKGAELILLTNATLFKGEKAQELERLDREKVRFQASLDGANPATNDAIRGKGSFASAVEGLRFLASLGFQTSVTTAVTVGNLRELGDITRLAKKMGVQTQHLMWLHRRGRIAGQEVTAGSNGHAPVQQSAKVSTPLPRFPATEELIEAVREVRRLADELGVRVDNVESIRQRVNARPGVKYDLGNACWDSLCVYSDGTVYPSAALANLKPLALGALRGSVPAQAPDALRGDLREIWERSPVAEAFRQATVARKPHLADDPLRYLTGGGDLEHSFWFNLRGQDITDGQAADNGRAVPAALAPERITQLLCGPDPYEPVYRAMIEDAMWELAERKQAAVNRRSGYDAPRVLHGMGEGAIHCATDDLAVTGEVDVRTLHSNCVLAFDVDKPRRLVREFYGKAAETPAPELCCPTKFDPAMVGHIPKEVIDRFYGCGSPVTMADLKQGETMLDLGSGAGIDCFIAAKIVGPKGKAIGVDMTDAMLEVANENRPIVAANLGWDVVEFRKGFLEQVPAESKSVDLVTSNCVINLSPDKRRVFAEIWRILKDNGRMVVADIVSDRPVPAHLKVNPQLWGECIVGALTEEEFLAQLQEAGFYGLSILRKAYWKTVEGYDFYSVTVRGFKFEKTAGCRFIGQRAVYLGPMKSVMDEEGHLFPRDVPVEVCTDTAAKLSHPPYEGSFAVIASPEGAKQSQEGIASVPLPPRFRLAVGVPRNDERVGCGPGCC